ncbi:MAG TPA: helix-turn-helix transcriptional regulator [Roseomonas sp.]|jgi:transcriptional regulator with XRE-family HTH domain
MDPGFGERLRQLRKLRNMTYEELSRRTGTSKGYLYELESNKPPRPSANKILILAEALGVTADYLLGAGGEALDDAEDAAFINRYRQLSADARRKIRDISSIVSS